jgi:hypothetical protein
MSDAPLENDLTSRKPSRIGRPKAGDAIFWNEDGSPTIDALRMIERAAGMGLPKFEISALLGMSSRTFYVREKEYPEIVEYMEYGEAAAGLRVANALLRRAEVGDMAAIRWFEMTRKGRSERTEVKTETRHFVIQAPPLLEEAAWEDQFSPERLTDGSSPTD